MLGRRALSPSHHLRSLTAAIRLPMVHHDGRASEEFKQLAAMQTGCFPLFPIDQYEITPSRTMPPRRHSLRVQLDGVLPHSCHLNDIGVQVTCWTQRSSPTSFRVLTYIFKAHRMSKRHRAVIVGSVKIRQGLDSISRLAVALEALIDDQVMIRGCR